MSDSRVLSPDKWLSEVFGFDAYRLSVRDAMGEWALSGVPLSDLLKGKRFVYTKVDVDDVESIQILERHGFHLIDTNIILEKSPPSPKPVTASCTIRFARPEDEEAVVRVAASSFHFDRFHADPKIPNDLTDRVKGEWARNFFRGARGDHLIVAEVGGQVVGFNLLIQGTPEIVTVDLIAVDPSQRRKGIAHEMIAFAESALRGVQTIRVGTQLSNLPSVRLYESMGYRLGEAHYVFHFHGGE